ncbi:MAG: DUF1345 domain-containing protein [Cellulomonadaceae bacterium]
MTAPSPSADLPGSEADLGARPHVRLIVAVLVGVGAAAALTLAGAGRFAPLGGWITTAAVYCAWTWANIAGMDPGATASHATRESPGRAATSLLLICGALASLVGVGFLLFGQDSAIAARALSAAVAFCAIVASWFTLHTLFALRYAREYYTGPDGGIDFHQDEPPRYTDFAYVAFTVGMSFAISDTDVGSSAIRRVALGHAMLSYLFGTVIVAALVNLVAGL